MSWNKEKSLKIFLTIGAIVIVAILGSVFVNLGMEWFDMLDKPMQWIPNIVIPIMWTIIYIIFGIVLTMWIIKVGIPKDVVVWLIINGILNIIWCLVFFTLNLTFVGNIIIVLNLIAGIVLYLRIYRQEPLYAIITSVYPIWLCLATTLNTALWILN